MMPSSEDLRGPFRYAHRRNLRALADRLDKVQEGLGSRARHNQAIWGRRTPCGTTACAAGWEVIRARDLHPEWELVSGPLNIDHPVYIMDYATARLDNETFMSVPDWAALRLGLNERGADKVFHAARDSEVPSLLRAIANGKYPGYVRTGDDS